MANQVDSNALGNEDEGKAKKTFVEVSDDKAASNFAFTKEQYD